MSLLNAYNMFQHRGNPNKPEDKKKVLEIHKAELLKRITDRYNELFTIMLSKLIEYTKLGTKPPYDHTVIKKYINLDNMSSLLIQYSEYPIITERFLFNLPRNQFAIVKRLQKMYQANQKNAIIMKECCEKAIEEYCSTLNSTSTLFDGANLFLNISKNIESKNSEVKELFSIEIEDDEIVTDGMGTYRVLTKQESEELKQDSAITKISF